ncbi:MULTISPECIES: hypothetical protein [unclassified Tolypothrix]|uniref:hypothetical protein n=1 Tax=unclassified Tolypothrix TaxID=2649714 RepID=UPI0005EAC7E1|nr:MULTISPECIES: hypothetical protein [unclassified Tolypothrix]BAY92294.1 hypothetical protein NIES3275_43280 [Microchaete diplosiphon NIES-3275]EKE98478.1 hypothetical protein FDUTEX481_04012 [Tolypothrix sp. PCC 7601]MBE9084783.1 hypothetical protein [Tolypothrix sp. LEGE 11397]UYD26267.1 hypothetical protein HGR01_34085 [Tolypothrix sp. PCC 7712]UYD31496.1 hypothetical protein HG267_20420 [Tolypothrix sp. PCC 7601]
MKDFRLRIKSQLGWLLALGAAIVAQPVIAQTANFGTLKLSAGFNPAQGVVEGYTGGSYSLSAISNRDREKKACIGFADPQPDHIITLEKDFARLKFLVNSGGYDTTMLIQGPDDSTIRCGDDTGKSKDASIDDRDFKSGTYRIWIGTFNSGDKHNYTLTVQQP